MNEIVNIGEPIGRGFFGFSDLAAILGIAFWIGLGCFCVWLAREKGRPKVLRWFILGLIYGPIAILALGLAPPQDESRRKPKRVGPARVEYESVGERVREV